MIGNICLFAGLFHLYCWSLPSVERWLYWSELIPLTSCILGAHGEVWCADISHKFSLASLPANGCLSAGGCFRRERHYHWDGRRGCKIWMKGAPHSKHIVWFLRCFESETFQGCLLVDPHIICQLATVWKINLGSWNFFLSKETTFFLLYWGKQKQTRQSVCVCAWLCVEGG